MRVELTELFWHDEQKDVSLTELSELSGLSEAELQELVDCGAIVPAPRRRERESFAQSASLRPKPRAACAMTLNSTCRVLP